MGTKDQTAAVAVAETAPAPAPAPAPVAAKESDEKRTVEAWAAAKGHNPQPFGQTRMLKGWITGSEVTEKEYDAAVVSVEQLRFG